MEEACLAIGQKARREEISYGAWGWGGHRSQSGKHPWTPRTSRKNLWITGKRNIQARQTGQQNNLHGENASPLGWLITLTPSCVCYVQWILRWIHTTLQYIWKSVHPHPAEHRASSTSHLSWWDLILSSLFMLTWVGQGRRMRTNDSREERFILIQFPWALFSVSFFFLIYEKTHLSQWSWKSTDC